MAAAWGVFGVGIESDLNPITIDTRDLLHPNLPEPLSIEFCRAAIHAGAQTPINGVLQFTDKVCGTNYLPKVQFIDPCPKAEFLSTRWHTQQFGVLFGTAANLLILQKCVGKAGDAMFGHIENAATHQFQMALRSVQEAAVTGFIHNAVFKPVEPSEGEFYTARLNNGLVGAGTWATLQAGSVVIKRMGQRHDNFLGAFLRSEVGSTVLSGVPGGYVQANMKSLLKGDGLACHGDIAEAIYTQSILGGAWAGGKQIIGGTRSENNLSNHMQIASLIARGKPIPPHLSLLDPALPLGTNPFKGLPGPIFQRRTPDDK